MQKNIWFFKFDHFKHGLTQIVIVDWRTMIHFNVDLTIFQLNPIYQSSWNFFKLYFNLFLFSNWGDKVLKGKKTMGQSCLLFLTRIRTLSLRWENNVTIKYWYNNFPTTLIYVVMLENFRNNISKYCCSQIKGTRF